MRTMKRRNKRPFQRGSRGAEGERQHTSRDQMAQMPVDSMDLTPTNSVQKLIDSGQMGHEMHNTVRVQQSKD